jgi:hypothetical protein
MEGGIIYRRVNKRLFDCTYRFRIRVSFYSSKRNGGRIEAGRRPERSARARVCLIEMTQSIALQSDHPE